MGEISFSVLKFYPDETFLEIKSTCSFVRVGFQRDGCYHRNTRGSSENTGDMLSQPGDTILDCSCRVHATRHAKQAISMDFLLMLLLMYLNKQWEMRSLILHIWNQRFKEVKLLAQDYTTGNLTEPWGLIPEPVLTVACGTPGINETNVFPILGPNPSRLHTFQIEPNTGTEGSLGALTSMSKYLCM